MSYANRASVMGVGVTFIATSITAVAVRFAMRLRHSVELGADDWLALAAMILVIGASGVCIAGSATDTLGSHSPDIGPAIFTSVTAQQTLVKELEFAFYAIQIPALMCLKLSVLLLYRRIFQIDRAFKICFWILAITSVAWGVAFFIAWGALCNNFENRLISLMTLTTKCAGSFNVLVCQAVFDVVVDLAILALPVPFVLQLQMSKRRKAAVLGILLVGSLAIGCGIARMVIVGMILGTPIMSVPFIAGERTTDFVGIVSLMVFWGELELGVGMIAICLPTLRPLFKGMSVESMLRSLRSFVSLAGSSRASSVGRGSDQDSLPSDDQDAIEKSVSFSVRSASS